MAEYVIYLLGPVSAPSPAPPRWLRVYVPTRAQPGPPPTVLYVFDGQNVFHDAPSFAGGWHLHRAAESLARRGLPAPIVVGIDNGGAERIGELSPWPGESTPAGLDAMLDWIAAEVMPRVSAEFGAPAGPAGVCLGGSSMGGLAALYGHLRNPERFGAALCLSPSLWFAQGRIFEYVASRPRPEGSLIYLDAGGDEGAGSVLKLAARMAEQSRKQGHDGRSLRFVADKTGTHSEIDWRRRAPGALKFLLATDRAAAARLSLAPPPVRSEPGEPEESPFAAPPPDAEPSPDAPPADPSVPVAGSADWG